MSSPLSAQIESQRRRIHTDAYSMSLGELVNMYKDGDLFIHPAYQRLFRWTTEQKSSLIDSILLRIPLPSIFVAQRQDAKWEIIDGLQRISTILQLNGVLKDADGKLVEPLRLIGTPNLPDLNGRTWSEGDRPLSSEERLLIKQAKIDVKIVLRESDEESKYELFKRLNTGGSTLTEQEVRTCMTVMINSAFAEWLKNLSEFPDFRATIPITENQLSQQYDMDLVSRFFALKAIDPTNPAVFEDRDINEVVTDQILAFAKDPTFDLDAEAAIFRSTFSKLNASLGENAFKRFDAAADKFKGPPVVSLFEVLAIGLGINRGQSTKDPVQIAKQLGQQQSFVSNSGGGIRPTTRVKTTLQLGRQVWL